MKNIFIFGASIAHGVGGERGGWADKLKASLHRDMFGGSGTGEVLQIYELGVPGTTLPDILDRLDAELKARIHKPDPEQTYILFSGGTNDSKAVDQTDNHISSPRDFAANVHAGIHLAKDYSNHLMGIGIVPVDESKTMPKQNPITGGTSYFSNQRLKQFESAFWNTCMSENVQFVPLFDQVPANWAQTHLWQDGVHPNDEGHEWIRSQVEPRLRELLGPPV